MDVEKKFEENLELVKDEWPNMKLITQLKIVADRTVEDVTRFIYKIADQREWAHKEAVNKAFYE